MRLHPVFSAVMLSATVACGLALPAHADTIATFNATGTFDDGSTLSGTIEIDTTAGGITGEDLVVSSPFSAAFINDISGQGANDSEYI